MTQQPKLSSLNYYIRVTGEPSEDADAQIPGAYLVTVDEDVEPALRAAAALDAFHEDMAIECLDDFTITVFDANGTEVSEPDDYDSSSLAMSGRAQFQGPVDEEDMPTPAATSKNRS